MIKALVPRMLTLVADRAMQTFGAMGTGPDTPLAEIWTEGRALRIADGPDEVHLRAIARLELQQSAAYGRTTADYLYHRGETLGARS
jgi:acyl-CoA dehydrogenase